MHNSAFFTCLAEFIHLVPLHLPFQYFKNAIHTNVFFLFVMHSPLWVQKHKCSLMALLLLFSPHLCKTKVMQQLVSVTSVTSIPFTWVLNIPTSCLRTSLFYCAVHTLSSCKDEGCRQPWLRRNKRPFISFSYTIIFLIFFFFWSKEDMENRNHMNTNSNSHVSNIFSSLHSVNLKG